MANSEIIERYITTTLDVVVQQRQIAYLAKKLNEYFRELKIGEIEAIMLDPRLIEANKELETIQAELETIRPDFNR